MRVVCLEAGLRTGAAEAEVEVLGAGFGTTGGLGNDCCRAEIDVAALGAAGLPSLAPDLLEEAAPAAGFSNALLRSDIVLAVGTLVGALRFGSGEGEQ